MIKNLSSSEFEVLEYFFLNPKDRIHIRGLSEELGMSYATVRSALNSLEGKNLLEVEKLSKMTFYSPGEEEFGEFKRYWNLQRLEESGVIELIEKELRPEAVVLIGSFLDGRDSKDSDIDLVIVDGRDTSIELEDFENDLKRSIQLVRVKNLSKENEEFRNSVANGYVLSGYIDLF